MSEIYDAMNNAAFKTGNEWSYKFVRNLLDRIHGMYYFL